MFMDGHISAFVCVAMMLVLQLLSIDTIIRWWVDAAAENIFIFVLISALILTPISIMLYIAYFKFYRKWQVLKRKFQDK